LVTGVWVGNADNEPMGQVSGVAGAAPIWHDVMETLLKGRPAREFEEPPGMVRVEVCADSGLPPVERAAADRQPSTMDVTSSGGKTAPGRQQVRCPHTVTEHFIEGTEPTRPDDWHWLYTLDARNGLLAWGGCAAQFTTQRRYTLYPAGAQDWVRWQSIPQPPTAYSPLCPKKIAREQSHEGGEEVADAVHGSGSVALAAAAWPLVLTSPDQGSRYSLSPEIPQSAQKVVVAARPGDGISLRQVTLLVDGRPLVTSTSPPYQALWSMAVGMHVFRAVGVDANGNEVEARSVEIEVVGE
jgi:membrane carboxypeptidase/penicillin-binding protein PbpC